MARLLAIGDVHGCLTALETLLGVVKPTEDDEIVMLGDYIDRGPDSRGVIEYLRKHQLAENWTLLRGNHEIMMVQARHSRSDRRFWQAVGGQEALESYADHVNGPTIESVPDAHWLFLDRLSDWYETEEFIFVHAGLHPDRPLQNQETNDLHWEVLNPERFRPHCSGKTIVCGHTEQRNGTPLVLPGVICLDTWAYGNGWLTCMDLISGKYWQANDLGEVRAEC
ncbi:MAG: metallophosphoesterase family protein [Zavarzinella sp.]